jgi:tyrosine-protein kinase Etk/Wzc
MFASQPEQRTGLRPVAPAPPPPSPPPPDAYDVIDLRDYADLLVAGRWTLAATTALALVGGVAFAVLSTPIYEAQTLIQVEDQRSALPGFEAFSGLSGAIPIESEVEILRSRFVLGQVVDQLDLRTVVIPDRFPVVGSYFARRWRGEGPAPARFGAQRHAWGGETVRVDRLEVASHLQGQPLTLIAGEGGRYAVLGPGGRVVLEGEVGEAAATSGEQPEAEIFVSALVARPGTRFHLVRRSRLRAMENLRGGLTIRSRGSGGFLEVTLQGTEPDRLQRILDELANTYLRQHVERGSAEARSRLAFLEAQMPEVRAQLEEAEERFNAYRRERQAVDLSADTQHLLSRIVSIESELGQLDLQILDEGQRFAAQHPRMQTLRSQRSRLQAAKADLERRVDALPDRQQEVLRLRREVDVTTHLYTNLLNTSQELGVVQAGTIGNVRIIDHAVTGERPVKPRRSLTVALSLALGLMLGMGLVFGRNAFHRAVDDPDSLEQSLGLPVYTVIPHSRAEAAARRRAKRRGQVAPILARDQPQDPAVEGLRSFRTSLHFALPEAGCNVIAVTSPHADSGKSFICVNAGHVFAEAGKKVLVVDADLRRGRLHDHVDRGREPGLSEILAGRVEAEEAIHSLEGTDLDVLTTGTLPPNPSELLMSPAWRLLLDALRARYDFVVVDTPPILAVTDAAIIGATADAVFLVARAGRSRIEEVASSLRRLEHGDLKVTGLLFNDMGARRSGYGVSRYEHYYRYDYLNREGDRK